MSKTKIATKNYNKSAALIKMFNKNNKKNNNPIHKIAIKQALIQVLHKKLIICCKNCKLINSIKIIRIKFWNKHLTLISKMNKSNQLLKQINKTSVVKLMISKFVMMILEVMKHNKKSLMGSRAAFVMEYASCLLLKYATTVVSLSVQSINRIKNLYMLVINANHQEQEKSKLQVINIIHCFLNTNHLLKKYHFNALIQILLIIKNNLIIRISCNI